ncbi:MAG: hypothetical protein Q7S82_01695 [bacterium]|nr:hypothetical protein [bacterium]
MQNIIFQYFEWHFFEMPKNILKAWRNFLLFNLNYFSITLLLKTLFLPWRREILAYPRGFDVWQYLEVFFLNLISRLLGAIVRIVLIIFGIFVELLMVISGIIIFLSWLVLPIIIILGFILGFKNLF